MAFPLIITGMHRSGTSLVASFFHRCGVDLGDELIGPDRGNPLGHFEDARFVAFHTAVLEREGKVDGLYRPPRTTPRDEQTAAALVAAQGSDKAWGWKDPRTSLFLDFWRRIVPDATCVLMVRHPFAVVDSLRRRDGGRSRWWKADTMKLRAWSLYTRECLEFCLRNQERSLLFSLQHVLRSPAAFAQRAGERLGLELDADALSDVFQPSLLKDRTSPFAVRALPLDYARALLLYRQACRVSRRCMGGRPA